MELGSWRPVRGVTALLAAVATHVMCSGMDETTASQAAGDTARVRAVMVSRQIAARGISDARVLEAMRRVPRERFVPAARAVDAYEDRPLPIGFGQTISQPYIVAYMTEALELSPDTTVLEIGTGSGYQAAVLAEIVKKVYTVEIVPELAERARETLRALGYANVEVRTGDGYAGWEEHAPYDRIMVTAAPDHVPQPLVDQLAVNGRMVIPVGRLFQQMTIVRKTSEGVATSATIDVRFVPLVRTPPQR